MKNIYKSQKSINRKTYIKSIISITIALFLTGFICILLINGREFANNAKENLGFTLYIEDNAQESEITDLQKKLESSEYTESVKIITKEQAAEELKQELGDDFTSFLGYNPLPVSMEVKLKSNYSNIDSISQIQTELEKTSIIQEFFYQKSIVESINKNLKIFLFSGFVFLIILLTITIILINNTIKLSIESKTNQIRTAQMLGGDKKFISRPIVNSIIISGIISATIASTIIIIMSIILKNEYKDLIILKGMWVIIGIMFIFAVCITKISASISINRHLNNNSENNTSDF